MKYKSLPIIIAGVLLVLTFMLVTAFVPEATSAPKKSPLIKEAMLGWQLSNAQVVSAGKTSHNEAGVLTEGYVVEATATSIGESPLIEKGKFKLTVTAFSPDNDMLGQKAGLWYVRGDWSITDVNATSREKKTRYSPTVIKGNLTAELTYNPADTQGTVNAVVKLPMSPAAGRWAKGQGNFSGDEKFEGIMNISADLWPVMKVKGVKK